MKKKIIICFIIFISALFCLNFTGPPCEAMYRAAAQRREENLGTPSLVPMRFKFGLEFQEISGLCPWALEDYRLQKKPLFSLREETGPQTLWHVELDTDDIEFVTRPFTPEEGGLLDQCTQTIVEAVKVLQGLPQEVPFKKWWSALREKYHGRLERAATLRDIQDNLITKPVGWIPRFSPQATIQHPLEYSIPLYFGLFGFDDPASMFPLADALPYRQQLLRFYKEGNAKEVSNILTKYPTKVGGLMFLHALTLVQMVSEEDHTDEEYLEETLRHLTDCNQVDAKARLMLMSRRPFSAMLQEACSFQKLSLGDYITLFLGGLGSGWDCFHKSNYAEQFFEEETGRPKCLIHLLECFEEKFEFDHRGVLVELLGKGVVSTAMLRHIKPEYDPHGISLLLNNSPEYFTRIVRSVAFPTKRYKIDVAEGSPFLIREDDTIGPDGLSPPWFLDLTNSMGVYREALTPRDAVYGEAIIEVRAIRNVGNWFLNKIEARKETKGHFLESADENLVEEVRGLFGFLRNFGHPALIEDIKVGMTYAVFKY